MISGVEVTQWVGGLLWPFMRISALFTIAPIFSQKTVPRRARVFFSLAITVMIMPTLPPMPEVELFSAHGLLTSMWQIIIGGAMGFMLTLALNTVIVAGEKIAMSMGLGFATMVDPQNGVNVPVVAQFFQILAILLFFALNAHLVLIELIVDSFHMLPVGIVGLSMDAIWHIVAWGTKLFALSLLMALPTITAVLLVYLALGVMSRAAPQLNLFSVGFPLTILGGLMLIWLLLPNMLAHFESLWADVLTTARTLLVM